MKKISLEKAFESVNEYWSPKITSSLNGQLVKIAKIKGSFVWHHHAEEDELFLVHKGSMQIEFRDRIVELNAGEMLMIPRGVEHKPVSEKGAEIILFEPASTINTGNVTNELTRENLNDINE